MVHESMPVSRNYLWFIETIAGSQEQLIGHKNFSWFLGIDHRNHGWFMGTIDSS